MTSRRLIGSEINMVQLVLLLGLLHSCDFTIASCEEVTLESVERNVPQHCQRKGPIPMRGNNESGYDYYDEKSGDHVAHLRLKNGKIVKQELYKNSKLDGQQVVWYQSGQIKSQGNFVNGVMHGRFREWDEHGALIASHLMENGNGTRIVYFSSGMLNEFSEFHDNKMHGWYVTADIERIRFSVFKNGHQVGPSYGFGLDGRILEFTFSNEKGVHGPLIDFYAMEKPNKIEYYVDGVEMSEAQYMAAAKTDKSLMVYDFKKDGLTPLKTEEALKNFQKWKSFPRAEIPLKE